MTLCNVEANLNIQLFVCQSMHLVLMSSVKRSNTFSIDLSITGFSFVPVDVDKIIHSTGFKQS